ncbi:transcription termination factor NusA [Candidatus Anaplasma sp. TIGMIC]|uniref:transcription termination factor NusA n=1 Tax=Candidatus Anaplasma sp. TIGMIC TaxID=3020713 RepID=UPI00232E6B56|nr:transcription termination factor NusA [Candidatus Anaplasma sp. TIGMIC]MDB1135164.1 transcription termination factor NusA [Candidatus Anaplasma sp. TIGMIC]
MVNLYNFDNLELIRVARDVAEQRGLDLGVVVEAIEQALEVVSHGKYGDCKIKVSIDRKTGVISIARQALVVEDDMSFDSEKCGIPEDEVDKYKLVRISDALLEKEDAKVGDILLEPLPPIDVDYNSAKLAKQKVAQLIMLQERKRQYEEFKDRVGDLVYGVVKRVEYNNVVVDLNGSEGYLPVYSTIRGEVFRPNDRVKAHVEDVRREATGPQIFLSRVSKRFMELLFKQEIPEVYDGVVTIKALARDAGSRSKVAVFSSDKNVDPVGACIGARGVRIQNIVAELHGEKIDVVPYSSDLAKFVVSAIAPAEVVKVIIDEDVSKIELVVPESQVSLAIGRYGQNIRLASELVGWDIDVIGDETESTRKAKELSAGARVFIDDLDVEEIIGQLLVSEGFSSIEDLDRAEVSDIAAVDGFNEDIARELKTRAAECLARRRQEAMKMLEEVSVSEEVMQLPYLQVEDIVKLCENGVRSIEDIASLCTDEFYDIIPKVKLSKEQVDSIILESRKRIGWV